MPKTFDVPNSFAGAPYLEQYFGVWAIDETALQAHVEFAKNLNLTVHLNSEQAAAVRSSGGAVDAVLSDQVAVLSITGSLMKQASSMSGGTSTAMVRKAINSLAADPEVGAIVLRIDSPGGTVAGTEELANAIAAANKKKPVYAFIEDLGASAAYWLASQAREISANATALVGSIGTYGVVQDVSAAAAMQGVKVHVVRAGEHKGTGVPGTPITNEQLNVMQERVDALNSHFLAGVASGRGMAMERVASLADGRVHIASEAQRLGLIDQVSSLDATIARAQAAARQPQSKSRKPMAAISGSVTQKGGQRMSNESTTLEATSAAATIEQIEQACQGASPGFILAQAKRGATIEQASSAWMAEQVTLAKAEAKAAAEQAAAAQAELASVRAGIATAAQAAAVSSTGVDAIGSSNASGAPSFSTSANEQWNSLVAAERANGKSAEAALFVVDAANPGLREQVIQEANANRKQRR